MIASENTCQTFVVFIRKSIITRTNRKLKSTINVYLDLLQFFCFFFQEIKWCWMIKIWNLSGFERKYSTDLKDCDGKRWYCQEDWIHIKKMQWKTIRKSQPIVVYNFFVSRITWSLLGYVITSKEILSLNFLETGQNCIKWQGCSEDSKRKCTTKALDLEDNTTPILIFVIIPFVFFESLVSGWIIVRWSKEVKDFNNILFL